MRDKLDIAMDLIEENGGEATGYALIVFHENGVSFASYVDEAGEEAQEIVAELEAALEPEERLQ